MRLLLIEDSSRLRLSLSKGLKKLGYAVDTVGDGKEALWYLVAVTYDVVILDIMLPKMDGLTVLKQMRAQGNKTHVLILSAKDQVRDRIKGLESGADDYLVKPFSFDELHARICVLVRRAYDAKNPIITIDKLTFNTALKEIRVAGEPINLTPTELSLLESLLVNRGRVLSHERLEFKCYNSDTQVSRNAIEAHISSLRKKFKAHGICDLVKTRRGFGYYIES